MANIYIYSRSPFSWKFCPKSVGNVDALLGCRLSLRAQALEEITAFWWEKWFRETIMRDQVRCIHFDKQENQTLLSLSYNHPQICFFNILTVCAKNMLAN